MKVSLGHKDCNSWASPGTVLGSEPVDLGGTSLSKIPTGVDKVVFVSLLQPYTMQLTAPGETPFFCLVESQEDFALQLVYQLSQSRIRDQAES